MATVKTFCSQCDKWVSAEIIKRKEIVSVRGDDIQIGAKIPICSKCGSEICTTDIENENIVSAWGIYRERHGLLSLGEVREICERSGLSIAEFAELLGWSEETVARYERGYIPDVADNEKLVQLPETLR